MKNLYILCTFFISSLVLASNQSNELIKSFMNSPEYKASFETWKSNVIKYGLLEQRQQESVHIPVISYAQVIAFTDRQKTMQMLEVQIKQNQQEINYLQTSCERDYYKNKYQEASQKNVDSLLSEQDSSDISSLSFSNDDTSHSKTIIAEGNHVLDTFVNNSFDTIDDKFLWEESCVDTHVHTNNKNSPVYTIKKDRKNCKEPKHSKKGIVKDVETFTKEEIFYNLLQELKQRVPQQPAIDCTETKLVVTTIPQTITPAKHTKHKKSGAVKNIASALKNYSDKDDTAILEEAFLQAQQEREKQKKFEEEKQIALKEQRRADIEKKVAEARKKQEEQKKETLHNSLQKIFNIIYFPITNRVARENVQVHQIFRELALNIPCSDNEKKHEAIKEIWKSTHTLAHYASNVLSNNDNGLSIKEFMHNKTTDAIIIDFLHASQWHTITNPSEQHFNYMSEVVRLLVLSHFHELDPQVKQNIIKIEKNL